jgi:hypothetical protein
MISMNDAQEKGFRKQGAPLVLAGWRPEDVRRVEGALFAEFERQWGQ